MLWTIIAIVIGVILIFITSPTSALVGWFLSKFTIHPTLDPKDISVTYNGTPLDGEEKIKLSKYFNEAQFLERNHIFPGTENLFLQPETDVIPVIIKVQNGKSEMSLFLYRYDDHVDVVKQWKKKVASYRLRSEQLQDFTISL